MTCSTEHRTASRSPALMAATSLAHGLCAGPFTTEHPKADSLPEGTSREPSLLGNPSGRCVGERAFYSLQSTVANLERRASNLKGRAGYHAMLARLCNAKTALVRAENELNR